MQRMLEIIQAEAMQTDGRNGDGSVEDDVRYRDLENVRRSLIRSYVFHVLWFALMCTFAILNWSHRGLHLSLLLTLITVPPVLYFTVRMHHLCRAIDAQSRTVGLVPILITTFALSPFESGLILPLKNLIVCNKLLRRRPDQADPRRLPMSISGKLIRHIHQGAHGA